MSVSVIKSNNLNMGVLSTLETSCMLEIPQTREIARDKFGSDYLLATSVNLAPILLLRLSLLCIFLTYQGSNEKRVMQTNAHCGSQIRKSQTNNVKAHHWAFSRVNSIQIPSSQLPF
jgi:hypothetical protein